jgi:hypothetical protein
VFLAMVVVLERGMTPRGRRNRDTAQAIAALCVGGMVVARSMNDRALADELREASMAVALRLAGWEQGAGSRLQRSRVIAAR